jgi:two-component system response regulator YesN
LAGKNTLFRGEPRPVGSGRGIRRSFKQGNPAFAADAPSAAGRRQDKSGTGEGGEYCFVFKYFAGDIHLRYVQFHGISFFMVSSLLSTKGLWYTAPMGSKKDSFNLNDVIELRELSALLKHFSVVTGLNTALYSAEGDEILASRKEFSVCALAKNCPRCREYIAYGGIKSMELGEPYIYACGCGLVMCSSPIIYNETLAGSIACGPAILWEADEIAKNEFEEKTTAMSLQNAVELLQFVPALDCVNITSASQILFILVNSLSREYSVFLKQRAEINAQQLHISNLILERKIAAAGIRELEKHVSAVYPVETEKELIAFVQSGNKTPAVKILNDFLGVIFSFAGGNLDTIRIKLFELIAFLSRAAVDAGAPLREVNRITRESFEICDESTDFERLCFLTTRAMGEFIDTVYENRQNKKTSLHLTKAIEYIMNHYTEELTLAGVAGAVFVSEYYLSHLFRKEMNTTFSDYVSRVRIEKAKDLLRDTNVQIWEVAEQAGFNDPNYFAKIFKKNSGVSPKEYQSFFR